MTNAKMEVVKGEFCWFLCYGGVNYHRSKVGKHEQKGLLLEPLGRREILLEGIRA